MTLGRMWRMAALLALLALFVSVAVSFLVAGPARATDGDPPRMMVIGDSISAPARYNADGSGHRVKAWWAYVAEALDIPAADVDVSAQPGSGMLNRGLNTNQPEDVDAELDALGSRCNGTTFGARVDEVAEHRPDILLVAGGRNDFKKCVAGEVVRANYAEAEEAISSYLSQLREATDDIGLDPRAVYVMSPWGTKFGASRSAIAPMIEHHADINGFTWIEVPPTFDSAGYTFDGTHPNSSGARNIANQILGASDLRKRAGTGSAAGSGAAFLCAGFSGCARAGRGNAGFSSRWNRSYWGRNPRTDLSNYTAFRLTLPSRSASYPIGTKIAATWKDAAVAVGVPARSTPKVGDIAWWPQSNWNGAAPAAGHVALVEHVGEDGTAILVSEGHRTAKYRWIRYSGQSFPRAFLRFHRSDGTPAGVVKSVDSTGKGKVSVAGIATDPDAYTRGVRIRIRVYQNGRTFTSGLFDSTTFAYRFSYYASGLRPGAAKVRVYAYNAARSKGASHAVLGTLDTTIR